MLTGMITGKRTQELAVGFTRAAIVGLAGGVVCLLFKGVVEHFQIRAGLGSNVVEGVRTMPWAHCVFVPAAGMFLAALIAKWLVPRGPGAGFGDIGRRDAALGSNST